MDNRCMSNLPLDRSSLAFTAKTDCEMQSNTVHTTSSTMLFRALSLQKQIVICKAILSTRLLQQRCSALSAIAAPVPHKGNKEEADNMNGTSWSLDFNAQANCDLQSNTVHTTSSTTQFHAVFDYCPGARQSE